MPDGLLRLAALALLMPAPATGELPLPLILDKTDGLRSSQVHDIAVGPQGFLWLAGPSGLARYHGRGIEVFGTDDGLSTLGLRSLAQDPGVGLWVGHDAGLDHWTPEEGFSPAVEAAEWSFGFVESILPMAPGEVWLGTREGVVHFELDTGSVETFLEGKLVTSLIRSSSGVLWAAGPTLGLYQLGESGWIRPPHDDWMTVAPVSELAVSTGGGLFIGGERLLELDSTGRAVAELEAPWPGRPVTAILRTGDELWASMGGRVALFRATEQVWSFSEAALSDDSALAIEIDRQSNVWLGTDRLGAVKYSGLRSAISRLPQPCGSAVLAVAATGPGEITLGGTSCTWRARADSYEILETVVALNGLQAWDVLPAGGGRLWVASNQGLVELAPGGEQIAKTALLDPARCLLEAGGTLYVGTVKGLFARRNGDFEEQLTAKGESLGYVYTLEQAPTGRIWIGTLGKGLWTLEGSRPVERSDRAGLETFGNVYSMAFHADGTFALSENSSTLLFEPGAKAPSIRIATESPSWVLRFDEAGRLLRGSSVGLTIHDRRSGAVVHRLGTGSGLAGGEFTTSRSLLKSVSGRLVGGMDGGASAIDLAALEALDSLPSPAAVRVEGGPFELVDGKRRLTSGTWSLDVLPAVPWFLDEGSVRFRYRMRGFVDEWTELPADSASIRFTSLPVGSYQLEAHGISSLTGPGPTATLLSFEVVRPWWWALAAALGALAIAALGALLPWLRARALTGRTKALEGLVTQRTEDLQRTLEQMERMAMEDRLTNLPNRRRLQEELARLDARARRTGEDFVMIVMDLDSLKEVNDRWGHDAGDALLREAAARLTRAARKSDMVSRYGGDEFVILGWHDEGDASLLAERQRSALIGEPITLPDGRTFAAQASFGVCSWKAAACDTKKLFGLADRALYAAKRMGGEVVVWTEALGADLPAGD